MKLSKWQIALWLAFFKAFFYSLVLKGMKWYIICMICDVFYMWWVMGNVWFVTCNMMDVLLDWYIAAQCAAHVNCGSSPHVLLLAVWDKNISCEKWAISHLAVGAHPKHWILVITHLLFRFIPNNSEVCM